MDSLAIVGIYTSVVLSIFIVVIGIIILKNKD